jgi:hypothetical protein
MLLVAILGELLASSITPCRQTGAMDYLSWNNSLGRQFFRTENAGKRVFLYVTKELNDQIGATDGATEDFVAATLIGPPWSTRKGLCQRALQAMQDWRTRGCEFPPYIGYLGLFVLAATLDGPFPAYAYYPRLNALLGEPPHDGAPASFNRMYELWSDLEEWSNIDTDGQLGTFTADIAGGWLHVGIPVAQTVLTERERAGLPTFFAEFDFDPSAPPTDFELRQALLTRPPETLRPRSLTLLRSRDSAAADLCRALIGVVSDELKNWDGSVPGPNHSIGRRQVALRLCCSIDSIAAKVSFTLRCKASAELPAGELELVDPASGRSFVCSSSAMGWSSPLVERGSGAALDASLLDWRSGLTLEGVVQPLRLRLPALKVRVMGSGAQAKLAGFVEQRHLTPATPFYLVAHNDSIDTVERWGTRECLGFREVLARSGLPAGWRLYQVSAAVADSLIRTEFPNVSFPTALRLSLQGGVRVLPSSSQYFGFARPRVELVSGGEDIGVVPTCEGRPCVVEPGGERYRLPDGLPRGMPLRVAVESPDGTRLQRYLTLIDDFPRSQEQSFLWFDRFGAPALEPLAGAARYSGALVEGAPVEIESFLIPLVQQSEAVILVGRQPGQISRWPAQQYPSDWQPIWVVRLRRKGGAVSFCGTSIQNAEPSLEVAEVRRQVEAWKELIWHRRRRIRPPESRLLRSLWRRYQDVARGI